MISQWEGKRNPEKVGTIVRQSTVISVGLFFGVMFLKKKNGEPEKLEYSVICAHVTVGKFINPSFPPSYFPPLSQE